MKYKILLLIGISLLSVGAVFSQEISKNINYQAIARDSAGAVLVNKLLGLKLEITDSAGGQIFYAERHQVTTNQFGLFNCAIGGGIVIAGTYSSISWGSGKKFIRTSIDLTGGNTFQLLGSNELLSVPYALYALNAGISESGSIRYIIDSSSKEQAGLSIGFEALKNLDSVVVNSNNYAIGNRAGIFLSRSNDPNNSNDNILFGHYSGGGLGSSGTAGAAQNVMIGNYTGQYMNSAAYENVVIGHEAGRFSDGNIPGKTSVYQTNVSIGFRSLQYASNALANVSIGADNFNASKDVSNNVSIGANTGSYFSGDDNVLLGYHVTNGSSATGNKNVIIGASAAQKLQGDRNVVLGAEALTSGEITNDIVAIGYKSLEKNAGTYNTSIGTQSLANNTNGSDNVALGYQALYSNTFGGLNTAVGNYSQYSLTMNGQGGGSSGGNTSMGYKSLEANVSGGSNVAFGLSALMKNVAGGGNTAIGTGALQNNLTSNNIGIGLSALEQNTTGSNNIAVGNVSLQLNRTGGLNVAIGQASLNMNIGNSNTAIGTRTLAYNTIGQNNVAIGSGTLEGNSRGSGLTAIGTNSNVIDSSLNNSTIIGFDGRVSTSNTMSFGNAAVNKWAFGLPTTPYALQVGSNTGNGNGAYLTTGGTWTNASSIHFKENFSEISNDEILAKINSLEIPRWSYKGTTETHIGPLAEQFKEVFGLGVEGDNEHISTIDVSGIALRAVQALLYKNRVYEEKIMQLEKSFLELEKRVQKLEKNQDDKK